MWLHDMTCLFLVRCWPQAVCVRVERKAFSKIQPSRRMFESRWMLFLLLLVVAAFPSPPERLEVPSSETFQQTQSPLTLISHAPLCVDVVGYGPVRTVAVYLFVFTPRSDSAVQCEIRSEASTANSVKAGDPKAMNIVGFSTGLRCRRCVPGRLWKPRRVQEWGVTGLMSSLTCAASSCHSIRKGAIVRTSRKSMGRLAFQCRLPRGFPEYALWWII